MANNINVLVLTVMYMCVVGCNMQEESSIHTGTRNHMKIISGNNGVGGIYGV